MSHPGPNVPPARGAHARDLLALLGKGRPVAGAELATQLGLSRAAVWKQVEQLRAQGLPVAARRGRGYCLPWPVELLDAERIRALCRSSNVPLEVHWSLDSTSSECRRRAGDLADGAIVLAEVQQAGRGRRGRRWISPPGLNVYLSCMKRFDRGFAGLSGLSLAVGVVLVASLHELGIRGLGLKWPNDVLVTDTGAKLAGVLVELSGEYQGPSTAVIGIGLNLRLPLALREQAGQPVADLGDLADPVPGRNRIVANLADHLREGLARFDTEGFAAFAADYARLDILRGRHVRVSTRQESYEAIGDGVDAHGALCLRRDGQHLRVDSAEVSVRSA